MAGFDPLDSTSADVKPRDYAANLTGDIRGVRIGLPREYFQDDLDPGVRAVVDSALRELANAGAVLREVSLPSSHLSIPAYYVVAPAEASSNLSRFDGVRYGHRCRDARDLTDLYCRSRAEGFGNEVRRRIMIGTYVLSAGYYDAYYLRAQKVRRLISDEFKSVLRDVDVIAGPTVPGTAFALGERSDDPVSMYLSDIYTVSVNLAGLPAMSVPAGLLGGLPVGMQLIGGHYQEERLLQVAHAFQLRTDWHRHPAGGIA
jgi:aspartyl-tRNA(Asn)/glutamyl-tRNA(Gln) amidotransferase subunit A